MSVHVKLTINEIDGEVKMSPFRPLPAHEFLAVMRHAGYAGTRVERRDLRGKVTRIEHTLEGLVPPCSRIELMPNVHIPPLDGEENPFDGIAALKETGVHTELIAAPSGVEVGFAIGEVTVTLENISDP